MTGLWIPIEVVQDTSLTATEKFILSDIISMVSGGLPYFKSNATIALEFNVSQGTVSRSIGNLIEKKHILLESFDGRRRNLICNAAYSKMSTQGTQERVVRPIKNEQAALRKTQHNNTTSKQVSKQLNIPAKLNWNDALTEAWGEWNDEQKSRRKKPYTPRAQMMAAKRLMQLSKGDADLAIELINYAILRRWDTFWDLPKDHNKHGKKGFNPENFTPSGIINFIEQG